MKDGKNDIHFYFKNYKTEYFMSKKYANQTSDFLPWEEAMELIRKLEKDKKYKMCLFVAIGCFSGLRVSDILSLTWEQLLDHDELVLIEKKTKKKRTIRINPQLGRLISCCYERINPVSLKCNILISQKGTVFSTQRINMILKEIKRKYKLSAKNFSCHSLRKTFGREVYNQNSGNAELALVKLMELFNHSSVAITKRYLGLRQEELMEAYDCLTF